MSTIVGPIKGIVHTFDQRTYGGENGNTVINMVAQVTDEDAIAKLREALATVIKEHAVSYKELEYAPIKKASESGVEGATEGWVVRSRYRFDAQHTSPFTLDGRTYLSSAEHIRFEKQVQAGRVVKFAVRLSGSSPNPEATVVDGKTVRRATPAGSVYCDLIAVVPLNETVEIGTALEQVDWGLDGEDLLSMDNSPVLPNTESGTADDDGIPF